MRNRTPVYAAVGTVLAPAATIRLAGFAVAAGAVSRSLALALLVAGPLALGGSLLATGWLLGVSGRDPLDGIRTRRTVRDQLPADAREHLSEKTLDRPATPGTVPRGLFVYGLCYAVVVPVVSLVVMT
ncbi:MAG: hypothetical protein ABEJ40_01340 [Haloarculaceae archaeon]